MRPAFAGHDNRAAMLGRMISSNFCSASSSLLKMAMTAAVVVVTSVVVERSGPLVGALIAALPTAAGAAYIILAIEHPSAFIAASAVGSVAGDARSFGIYARPISCLAQRRGCFVSLGVAHRDLVVRGRRHAALGHLDAAARAWLLNVVVFGSPSR